MTKTDFIHELKQIATIIDVLEFDDRRQGVKELKGRTFGRMSHLLDIAVNHLPEKGDL